MVLRTRNMHALSLHYGQTDAHTHKHKSLSKQCEVFDIFDNTMLGLGWNGIKTRTGDIFEKNDKNKNKADEMLWNMRFVYA